MGDFQISATQRLRGHLYASPKPHKLEAETSHMASPFNIISNSAALPVPPPSTHPRPEWLRVKFFGGKRYPDFKRIIRTPDLPPAGERPHCPHMRDVWESRTR